MIKVEARYILSVISMDNEGKIVIRYLLRYADLQ